MRIRLTFFALILFVWGYSQSQTISGEIVFRDANQIEKCPGSLKSMDSISINNFFVKCIATLHQKGFIEARIDSVAVATSSERLIGYGFRGEKYSFVVANADSLSSVWLKRSGLTRDLKSTKPFKPRTFVNSSQKLLAYLDQNGYPFAKIIYKNATFNGDTIGVDLKVLSGPFIKLDTLYIKGGAKVSHRFVESYLNFQKGSSFSTVEAENYDQKINKLGFIKTIRSTEVEFIPGKARIYSYIENKPSSQFSGLIGFATPTNGSSSIQFTGDVNLRLVNVFRQGERNIFQWQALGEGTQRLNLSSSWTYLLGSKVGLMGQFKLFRRDTTYLNINPRIDVTFAFPSGSNVSVGADFRKTLTIEMATDQNIAGVTTSLYQVAFNSGIFSEEVFPTKYLWVSTSLGIGNRVRDGKDSKIRSTVAEIGSNALAYFPVYNPFLVVHLHLQGEMLSPFFSEDESIIFLDNELYRIGGINTIRGFNQESILASAYGIGTFELQFRLREMLNLYLFYDHSMVSFTTQLKSSISYPFGLGFGFQAVTMGGVLNFSYGVGKGMGEDFLLRSAKIHVGYIANF